MTGALYLIAFATLGAVFLIRIPSAIRSRHARLSWLACGVGTLALLTLGPVIPVTTMDAALGGTNVIYLVQCWLALLAFWLVTEAARSVDGRSEDTPHRPWYVLLYCGVIAIPFFFIEDRAPTHPLFVQGHTDQLAAVLCASLYMIGIAFMSIRLVINVRKKESRSYWLFRIGVVLILVAIVTQIVGLFAAHLKAAESVVDALYAIFDPCFYSGVLLIVTGIAVFWAGRHLRAYRSSQRIRRLQRILEQRSIALPQTDDDKAYAVYALLIRITDSSVLGRIHLTREEAKTVEEAEQWIERILPQLVRVTG